MSLQSINDKDNEMIPGKVHRSPVVVDHGAMGCGQKNLVIVAMPPAPVQVPSQRPLAPSVASVMSVANVKGDKTSFNRQNT